MSAPCPAGGRLDELADDDDERDAGGAEQQPLRSSTPNAAATATPAAAEQHEVEHLEGLPGGHGGAAQPEPVEEEARR